MFEAYHAELCLSNTIKRKTTMKIFCPILLLDPVISQLKTDWMAMIYFISKIGEKKKKKDLLVITGLRDKIIGCVLFFSAS